MPTVGLHMIVRDCAASLERCLRSVLRHVDEAVIVDTGSKDATPEVARRVCSQFAVPLNLLEYSAKTHPESFLHDVRETWDDRVPPPFSGDMLLANFGGARQYGWCRGKCDYKFWLDSDDVLYEGQHLHAIATELERDNVEGAVLVYEYAHDHLNRPVCLLQRERLVRASSKAEWTQPIHEVLAPVALGRLFPQTRIVHCRQHAEPPTIANRNLKVLYHHVKEGDPTTDPRLLFYLGMEERVIWPDKAIRHLEEYVERSGWDEERTLARYTIGIIHESRKELRKAFRWYAEAMADFTSNPDPCFGLARIAYFRTDWGKCIELTERALATIASPTRIAVLMHDPMDRTFRPFIFLVRAFIETGQVEKAIGACKKGLEIAPDDPHLRESLKLCETWKERQADSMQNHRFEINSREPLDSPAKRLHPALLVSMAIEMWKENMEAGFVTRAVQYLDALPPSVAVDPRVTEARRVTLDRMPKNAEGLVIVPPRESIDETKISPPDHTIRGPISIASTPHNEAPAPAPAPETPGALPPPELQTASQPMPDKPPLPEGKLDITFWVGPSWEYWNPSNINEGGIGGSETAVAMMSRELTKRGHRVTVFSDCPGKYEGKFDGADWFYFGRLGEWGPRYETDVFVSSRQPAVFAQLPIKSKANLLWVHDIHVGDPKMLEVHEGILRSDRILALSNWHKEHLLSIYPFIHPSTVLVTRNGIDTSRYAAVPIKLRNKLIFSSSPNRGLDRLLSLFPLIQKEVPDVELHIYYGFDTWAKVASATGNAQELEVIEAFRKLLASFEGRGVYYHGRVSQKELAEAQLGAKVWAYPTAFTETSCISAMECEAAGAVVVSTALAALPETVSHGFLLKPPFDTEAYGKAFVSRVVNLLKNEEQRGMVAQAAREYALANFGWDKVAAEWETMLATVIAEKKDYPLTLYGKE